MADKKLLLKNATVVLPHAEIAADVLVEDGKVSEIRAGIECAEAKTVDLSGKHLFPGFVDIHCHLREPGFEYKEDIASGTAAAVAGGFTSVCCMPNTKPVADSKVVISYIKQRAAESGMARVFPIAALTEGQRGETLAPAAALKAAGAVALSDDGQPVERAGMMRLALEYASQVGLPVISHCEDMSIANGGCANEGANATRAGLKGISRAAEEVMVARDIILAETLKTSVHIAHISTAGSAQLIREAKARGVRVTCETCPHYFCADDSLILDFDGNAKVNPPLRTQDDVRAIAEAIADGTVDAIATDHAPHSREEKEREFIRAANGISGFETAFALSYTYLVRTGIITLPKLCSLLTDAPSRILNLPAGKLAPGEWADITVADLGAEYKIDPEKFVSKGKNSPLGGRKVFGKIVFVTVGGEIKLDKLEEN